MIRLRLSRFVATRVGLLALVSAVLVPRPVGAQLALDAGRKWLLYGDIRFRWESGWD